MLFLLMHPLLIFLLCVVCQVNDIPNNQWPLHREVKARRVDWVRIWIKGQWDEGRDPEVALFQVHPPIPFFSLYSAFCTLEPCSHSPLVC